MLNEAREEDGTLTCRPMYPHAMYVRMGCSMTWTEEAFLLRVVRMVKSPSPTDIASRPPWKFSCLVRWSPLAPEGQHTV